jgi:hypothetical protein
MAPNVSPGKCLNFVRHHPRQSIRSQVGNIENNLEILRYENYFCKNIIFGNLEIVR